LLGVALKGRIIARKPGHSINSKVTEELRQRMVQQRKLKDIPKYDPNKAPVYDINHICEKLHHRFPFLLVDKIIAMDKTSIVGVKNITYDQPFFNGHFPGDPIMPGVLQLEAMAQAGGILVLGTVEDPENYGTYFLKIDNAKFKDKVVPGDTLVMKLELTEPIRRGICVMKGRAWVGDKLVCESEMMAQIVKINN